MSYNIVEQICKLQIGALKHNISANASLSMGEYVREFRTIGGIFARQSGKSTFMKAMYRRESSLLFVHNYIIANSLMFCSSNTAVITFSNIGTMSYDVRGTFSRGLKYSCFLVDEFQLMSRKQKDDLYSLIDVFGVKNMLHDDFYVLMLGT